MKREQISLLLACIRDYLNYLWTMVGPSPERNNYIRVLQILKGKLLPLLESTEAPAPFILTGEEASVVRDMLDNLLQPSTKLASRLSQDRRADLMALKTQIERMYSL